MCMCSVVCELCFVQTGKNMHTNLPSNFLMEHDDESDRDADDGGQRRAPPHQLSPLRVHVVTVRDRGVDRGVERNDELKFRCNYR